MPTETEFGSARSGTDSLDMQFSMGSRSSQPGGKTIV